ncbi:MAG TPA: cupin domain-containing protein, partial [Thermoanaerobaculia bacterium]
QPTERAGDGRWFRVLVDARSGCEPVTQFIGFIPPGRAPEHFHEYEEVVCILAGSGRFWSGDESATIAAGSCVYLPRRQSHCLENTGTDTLQLCGLFYPAGSPAVRFHPGGKDS